MRSNASAAVMAGRRAGRDAGTPGEEGTGFDFGEAMGAIRAAL